MHLVEILLPARHDDGRAFDPELWSAVRAELVDRFGGLTAFARAPAEGLWAQGGTVEHDEIVIIEVMAQRLERGWWADFRRQLEDRFGQQLIVIRATAIERL